MDNGKDERFVSSAVVVVFSEKPKQTFGAKGSSSDRATERCANRRNSSRATLVRLERGRGEQVEQGNVAALPSYVHA